MFSPVKAYATLPCNTYMITGDLLTSQREMVATKPWLRLGHLVPNANDGRFSVQLVKG
jgi:hypothetical protein